MWHDGGLLLGLKQPLSPAGALLWRLDRPDELLEGQRLEPGQLTVAARVDLGAHHGRAAAFSDLEVGADGALLALSTVPEAPDAQQMGKLVRLRQGAGGVWTAEVLRRYPGLKPEGLARLPDGRALLVFDAGEQTPLHTYVDPSR